MSGQKLKTNVLCPIETNNRELDFRLFFAALCARPDNRIIIGQRHVMAELVSEMRNGLYVGQGIRPFTPVAPQPVIQKRFEMFKQNGFRLIMLDEEGGVMAGDEERWKAWLDQRLDVFALKSDDHVLTWGNWQRDYFRSQNPACQNNIVATGHPRFDLYKPQFRSYFNDDAKRWKEKYGDFVLINANFSTANHEMGSSLAFSPRYHYDVRNPQKRLDFIGNWAHVTQVWSNMVRLITRLTTEMPELKIVIRPHPSENMKFYNHVFGEVPNVFVEHQGSVGSWILASRAIIHDGCTTAIEAHFSDVPIINYKSVRDERYDLMLPNALGERCESEDRVLEVLHNILNGDQTAGKTKDLPPIVHDLIDNFQHDSFAQVVDYTLRCADAMPKSASSFDAALRNQVRHEKRNVVKTRWRKTFKPAKVRATTQRFYGFDRDDIARKAETIRNITNRDVRFTVLSWNIISVETAS